jgi:ATP-binding protein involved in chromosome partitioning
LTQECNQNHDSRKRSTEHSNSEKWRGEEAQKLKSQIGRIKHKIAIISGKGGVGKSTVTVNLAIALAMKRRTNSVGILDADIHGPCVPKMMGLRGQKLSASSIGALPVTGPLGIKVVSMDFLLSSDEAPVIWRGPLKMKAIQQFLSDIMWGDLDFMLVDLPPGTGDEPLSVMQLITDLDGVIIVTIPSEVSQVVVKKAVTFARQVGVPIIGIIENMSGFSCPECGHVSKIFKIGGGQKIANDMAVPFLGSIPIDPQICEDSDNGKPFIVEHANSPATKAFAQIVEKIERYLELKKKPETTQVDSTQESW